jgi:hypothetical protein
MIKKKIIITIVAIVAGTVGFAAYKYSVNVKTSLSLKSSTEAKATSSSKATAEASIKIQKPQINPTTKDVSQDFYKSATDYTKVKPKSLEEMGAKELGK